MKKQVNNTKHIGTFPLEMKGLKVDIKIEQQAEHFMATIWYKVVEQRPGAEYGHYLLSFNPFGTVGSWLGCFDLEGPQKWILESTIIQECKAHNK